MRGKRIETHDFFQVGTENGIVDFDGFGHGDSMGWYSERVCWSVSRWGRSGLRTEIEGLNTLVDSGQARGAHRRQPTVCQVAFLTFLTSAGC
jgi:hypothetical protein